MAVRITQIEPKVPLPPTEAVAVQAHLAIQRFRWINESSQESGTTSRDSMFDWIVNKKGVAYIKAADKTIPVFGAITADGRNYIRTVEAGRWTDDLLNLPVLLG